jgi:signal peptidase I
MIAPRPGIRLRAAWAAILSLVVPGLGHIYGHTWRLGIALIVANEALSAAGRLIAARVPPTVPGLQAFLVVVLVSVALSVTAATSAARRVLRAEAGGTPQRRRWFRSTWFIAIVVLLISIGVDRAIPFNWRTYNVPSASMVPNLMVGDYIAADARPGLHIQRGDVIIFTHPVAQPANAPNAKSAPLLIAVYVKRVIGLPGDRLAIRDGRVVLNGTPLPWRDDGDFIIPQYMSFGIKAHRSIETLPTGVSYTIVTTPASPEGTNTAPKSLPEITVAPGQVYVLGDNRNNSRDSSTPGFGTIPIGSVIGQARTIYWSQDRTRVMTPVK